MPHNFLLAVFLLSVTWPPEIIHTANLDFSGFSVMGVAKLKDSVYILCRTPQETVLDEWRPSSVIKVYRDHQPYTPSSEIKLDMTSPFDMAASKSNDCLYITDLNQVYVMTANQEIRRFLSWKWNPHTLSVSREGNVMLGKDDKPCCLERYTAKAVLVDRIQLQKNVASVKHAVETSTGNVVLLLEWTDIPVSTIGWTVSRDYMDHKLQTGYRGIYEVTKAGDIVRFFRPRTQFYQLDDPRHLALDSDGQVFVADHAKDRLTQFDSELNMVQVVEKPGMFGPKRLFYDEANSHLWIGHSKQLPTEEDVSGSINVCKISAYNMRESNLSCP